MFHQQTYHNPFRARCVIQPAIVEEVVDDEGYVEEIVKPIKRESRRYLPGERLLKRLNKDRERKRKKDRSSREDGDEKELDLDSIERALNNIVREF